MLSAGGRRFTLTTHVMASAGWFGAVVVFLALAVIGLASDNELVVRGAYVTMAPAAWFALVPLAHLSLFSGIVLALGTTWGLVRHYWVALKLLLTVIATAILLVYMETFRQMAAVAADPVVDLERVRNASPLVHSVLALLVLTTTTALSIYKPGGMTPYGMRARFDAATIDEPGRNHVARKVIVGLLLAATILALFGILHSTMASLHAR